ncbi:hypothetical protein B7463_g5105, partial [Scytalidium lignicola]
MPQAYTKTATSESLHSINAKFLTSVALPSSPPLLLSYTSSNVTSLSFVLSSPSFAGEPFSKRGRVQVVDSVALFKFWVGFFFDTPERHLREGRKKRVEEIAPRDFRRTIRSNRKESKTEPAASIVQPSRQSFIDIGGRNRFGLSH